MPKLIRKLEQKFWLDPQKADEIGGLQADALKNFKTTENALSVFKLNDNDIEKSVTRVLIAIACGRDKTDKIDYALFDDEILNTLNIKVNEKDGDTPDSDVNKLHIDLHSLTGDAICKLAGFIQNFGELHRLWPKDVEKAIRKGIEEGHLEVTNINTKLFDKLKKETLSFT